MKSYRLAVQSPGFCRVLVLALGMLAAGCASVPSDGARALPLSQQIESARTPTEHDAIARKYDQQAAQARTRVDEHRAIYAAYQRGPQYRWIDRVGVDTGMPAMPRHCEQLIRNDEEAVRIYSEMAQQHRHWAQQPPAGGHQ